ncbi:autotransporter domain-containing protein, partial [Ursidibacter arcticus]
VATPNVDVASDSTSTANTNESVATPNAGVASDSTSTANTNESVATPNAGVASDSTPTANTDEPVATPNVDVASDSTPTANTNESVATPNAGVASDSTSTANTNESVATQNTGVASDSTSTANTNESVATPNAGVASDSTHTSTDTLVSMPSSTTIGTSVASANTSATTSNTGSSSPALPLLEAPLLNGLTNVAMLNYLQSQTRSIFERVHSTNEAENNIWVNIENTRTTQKHLDNVRTHHQRNTELNIGKEFQLNSQVKLGGMGSYIHTSLVSQDGNAKANSWEVFGYGNYKLKSIIIHGYFGMGRSHFKNTHIFNEQVSKTKYHAILLQTGTGLSYPIHIEPFTITPMLQINYGILSYNDYAEKLDENTTIVKGQTEKSLIIRTGLEFNFSLNDKLDINLGTSIGIDTISPNTIYYTQNNRTPNSVKQPSQRLISNIGFGLRYKLSDNIKLDIAYRNELRKGYRSNQGDLSFNIQY